MLRKLDEAECSYLMAHGEFSPQVLSAADRVAVVLTQSWCSQWQMLRSWLEGWAQEPSAALFYVEYDRESYFEPLMLFKENHFDNRTIPYIRYYAAGQLAGESNFIGREQFARKWLGR